MRSPSLFSHATSELSQDALIAWLLDWASPEYEYADSELHRCGCELIHAFFVAHKLEHEFPSQIKSVQIERQHKHIDVLCTVNGRYRILIEDKTQSGIHSNQLERYLKTANNAYGKKNILPIYFKTEDQSHYNSVSKACFVPFLRKDLLKVLDRYTGTNDILLDYRSNIRAIEKEYNSFKTVPIDTPWTTRAWAGYFGNLQDYFEGANWHRVDNAEGGRLVFYWCEQPLNDCTLYLELNSSDELCVRISVSTTDTDERSDLRMKRYRDIIEESELQGLELEKPQRFGNGSTMAVCRLKGPLRETSDGLLEFNETVQKLRLISNFVRSYGQKGLIRKAA